MSGADFSYFDRVLSPVLLFTRDLDLFYANPVARRMHPWLTSVGLRLFCTEPSLLSARKRISVGHTVILPMESDLQYELIFQPVRDGAGSVEYVFGFVHCASLVPEDAIYAADEPLLRMIREEVSEPILEFLTLLDGEPFRSVDPKFGRVLASARKRLVRACAFLSRTEGACVQSEESLRICDASEVLALCAKCFPPMRFSPSERLYLPLGRDALIRIVTDVLTFLSVYRADGGPIVVSLEAGERENEIRFLTPHWHLTAESSEKLPSADLSFLHHRLSAVGGRLELDPGRNGSFRFSLIFPQVRLSFSDVVVGDGGAPLAPSSALMLEFLQDLSASDPAKDES